MNIKNKKMLFLVVMVANLFIIALTVAYQQGQKSMLPQNAVQKADFEDKCLSVGYKSNDGVKHHATLRIGAFGLSEAQYLSLWHDSIANSNGNQSIPAYMLTIATGEIVKPEQVTSVTTSGGSGGCEPTPENLAKFQKNGELVKL